MLVTCPCCREMWIFGMDMGVYVTTCGPCRRVENPGYYRMLERAIPPETTIPPEHAKIIDNVRLAGVTDLENKGPDALARLWIRREDEMENQGP